MRISGPRAGAALAALAGRVPEPRRAGTATLRHPLTDAVLDRALVLHFPGPDTATGEDLSELHLHGGRAVVAAVLDALAGIEGLRPAAPGEFTRRAFENGRIDLAEAEGLADLLTAETESQRRAALALAGGALSRQVEAWQARLLELSAKLEAAIDFSDEQDVPDVPVWRKDVSDITIQANTVISAPVLERLREGVRVVIGGPPNAGKSTLLNALAGREAAITSAIAGTTRDVVEAPTAIQGVPFSLVDTAGLREAGDGVEALGVERAKRTLEGADIILWLGPPGEVPDRDRAILVQSKSDIVPQSEAVDLNVSAKSGEGMERLFALLTERARTLLPREGEVAINARHRVILTECLKHLEEAENAADELVAAEALRLARASLDRVTGRAGVEDMLDSLFSRFCIGK